MRKGKKGKTSSNDLDEILQKANDLNFPFHIIAICETDRMEKFLLWSNRLDLDDFPIEPFPSQ